MRRPYFMPSLPQLPIRLVMGEMSTLVLTYSNESELEPIIDSFERPLGFYIFSKRKKFIKEMFQHYSYGGGVANDSMIQFANDRLPFGGVGHC